FRPISAEDEEQQPTEIESLCMNCYCNRNNSELLFLRALWLEQHGDPVGRQDPGPGSALHFVRQGPGGHEQRSGED
ncbi:ZPR1 isoform 6, partial [Pongo abelii]